MTVHSDYDRVERRLLRCDSSHADRLLQVYVEDQLDMDDLTYEDLVNPLKTTGGHLALRVLHTGEGQSYVRYVPPGYLEVIEDNASIPPTTIPPHDIKRWAASENHKLSVVAIENTPFGGVSDD